MQRARRGREYECDGIENSAAAGGCVRCGGLLSVTIIQAGKGAGYGGFALAGLAVAVVRRAASFCLRWRCLSAHAPPCIRVPERSSRLVTGGVYRFSRNPMYLALAPLPFCLGVVAGQWGGAGVDGSNNFYSNLSYYGTVAIQKMELQLLDLTNLIYHYRHNI